MKNLFLFMAVSCCFSSNAQLIIYAPNSCPDSCLSRPMFSTVFQNKLVTMGTRAPGIKMRLWSIDSAFTYTKVDSASGDCIGFTPALELQHNRMVVAGNRLFAQLEYPTTGLELYSWDGSANKPVLAWDIAPGSGDGVNVMFSDMAVLNDKVYLNSGGKLQMFDPGTNTGTQVLSITTGTGPVDPVNLTPFNNKLYFVSMANGRMYVYNPATTSGNAFPGFTQVVYTNRFVESGSQLYFVGRDTTTTPPRAQLYSMDTSGAVTKLTSIKNGIRVVDSRPGIGLFNNKLYVIAQDSVGHGLFEYDITTSTTTKKAAGYAVNDASFAVAHNKLYFNFNDSVNGEILWVYDGVNAPHMVAEMNPGTGKRPFHMVVYNNTLFFYHYTTGGNLKMVLDTSILAVDKIKSGSDYQLFPNPSEGRFILKGNVAQGKNVQIDILNIQGQVIYHDVTTPLYKELNKQIDLSGHAKGIYLVRVNTEGDSRVLRLVLE